MELSEEAVLQDLQVVEHVGTSSQYSSAESQCRLAFPTKVLYGAGGASDSIKAYSIGLFLLFFYTSVLGLSGTLLGIATAIGLLWDAVVDPFVGYWSDRARFHFGRRHSFMLAGSLFAGLGFFALFNPPAGLTSLSLPPLMATFSFWLRPVSQIMSWYRLSANSSRRPGLKRRISRIDAL